MSEKLGKVFVKVLEAQNLAPLGFRETRNYFATLTVDGETRETGRKPAASEVSWLEELEFVITSSSKQILNVVVCGVKKRTKHESRLYSICSIDISQLVKEVRTSNKWFKLWTLGGFTGKTIAAAGRIHLVITYKLWEADWDLLPPQTSSRPVTAAEAAGHHISAPEVDAFPLVPQENTAQDKALLELQQRFQEQQEQEHEHEPEHDQEEEPVSPQNLDATLSTEAGEEKHAAVLATSLMVTTAATEVAQEEIPSPVRKILDRDSEATLSDTNWAHLRAYEPDLFQGTDETVRLPTAPQPVPTPLLPAPAPSGLENAASGLAGAVRFKTKAHERAIDTRLNAGVAGAFGTVTLSGTRMSTNLSPVSKVQVSTYLNKNVVPNLHDGLKDLARDRPANPAAYLAKWLAIKSGRQADFPNPDRPGTAARPDRVGPRTAMGIYAYLDQAVVPMLNRALRMVAKERPEDPTSRLIEFFTEAADELDAANGTVP